MTFAVLLEDYERRAVEACRRGLDDPDAKPQLPLRIGDTIVVSTRDEQRILLVVTRDDKAVDTGPNPWKLTTLPDLANVKTIVGAIARAIGGKAKLVQDEDTAWQFELVKSEDAPSTP